MRLRKATLATAIALALATQGANALGVIGVHARSALYEPLNVDVKISLGPNDDFTTGTVSIAGPEQFAAAGIAYPSFANDLAASFERGSGKAKEPVLRLRSSRPIYDPVIRLVIQARVGGTGMVYLPVTIMLDSSFESPLGDSRMMERLPMAGKTVDKSRQASTSPTLAAPSAAKQEPQERKPKPNAAKAATAQNPKPASAPKTAVSATERPTSLAERVSALEANQQAMSHDMASVRQKLNEVGNSVQALRDLAGKATAAAKPADIASSTGALAAKPAEAAIKPVEAKPFEQTAKPAEAATKPAEAKSFEPAAKPAEASTKPAEAKPFEPPAKPAESVATAPAKPADAPAASPSDKPAEGQTQPPSMPPAEKPAEAATEASKPAEPPKKPAPKTMPAPAPVVAEAESSPILAYGIGGGVLALLGAGALWMRKRKNGKTSGSAHQSIDTDQEGVPTQSESGDTIEHASVEPIGSTDFGPKPPAYAQEGDSIDDLHNQIFQNDGVDDLIDAIKAEADSEKFPEVTLARVGDLQQSVDMVQDFDMPYFNLSDPGVDAAGQIPSTINKPTAPDLEKSFTRTPPTDPVEFDAGLDFDDSNTLDLTSIDFGGPKDSLIAPAPAPAPAPAEHHAPAQSSNFAMEFESIESVEPQRAAAADTMTLDDAFTQALNMSKSTEARSAGIDMGKRFVIAPNVEDSFGRLQLELACLYAQSQDWDNARSTLKEVISDEEMTHAHPEARRLMSMLP